MTMEFAVPRDAGLEIIGPADPLRGRKAKACFRTIVFDNDTLGDNWRPRLKRIRIAVNDDAIAHGRASKKYLYIYLYAFLPNKPNLVNRQCTLTHDAWLGKSQRTVRVKSSDGRYKFTFTVAVQAEWQGGGKWWANAA